MKSIIYFLGFCLLMGCATGNCRQTKDSEAKQLAANSPAPQPTEIPATKPIPGPAEKVKVFKYDGSLQCGMGKAISPEDMKKDLKSLTVHSATSRADGLMHIQQCGTPTGQANVFEIDKANLSEAKKRGFKEWTFD